MIDKMNIEFAFGFGAFWAKYKLFKILCLLTTHAGDDLLYNQFIITKL